VLEGAAAVLAIALLLISHYCDCCHDVPLRDRHALCLRVD
jgi:hypothetical protein